MDAAAHIEVVAAVMHHEGRVLACRRAQGRPAAGLWEFPGGKVRPAESQQEATRREVFEELGVEIEVLDLLERSVTTVAGIAIDLSCYLARVIGRLPTESTDHDQMRWLTRSELHGIDWAEPDLPAVARLAEEWARLGL